MPRSTHIWVSALVAAGVGACVILTFRRTSGDASAGKQPGWRSLDFTAPGEAPAQKLEGSPDPAVISRPAMPALESSNSSLRTPAETQVSLPPLERLTLNELQELLEERTYPLYEARFAAGLFQVVDHPSELTIPPDELVAEWYGPDGITLRRTVLPEANYPLEYLLLREIQARLRAAAIR